MIIFDKIFNKFTKRRRIVELPIPYGFFTNRAKLSRSMDYIKNQKILINAVFTKRMTTDCCNGFQKVIEANIAT